MVRVTISIKISTCIYLDKSREARNRKKYTVTVIEVVRDGLYDRSFSRSLALAVSASKQAVPAF